MENDNNVFSVKLVGFPGTMVDRVIELTGSFEVFLK